jgi:hypothetical protein
VLRTIFRPKRDEVTGGWREREEHRLGVFENRVLRRIFGPKRDEETAGWREREEHRLGVFENRVLRRIFGPKRDEWRKLLNEELRDLSSSPSIIRIIKAKRMRTAGYVARMGRSGTRIHCWWESQSERGH